jgi:hypothetical protein
MTTDSTTSPETTFATVIAWTQTDPVRNRVAYQQPLTNFEKLQTWDAQSAKTGSLRAANLGIDLPDTPGPRLRRPHPGDILYWVACVGGACGLLFCAFR